MVGKINVLIPNATGPTNIGDQAILHSLLNLLRDSKINMNISILTTDPQLYKKANDLKFDESLYEWAMSDSLNFQAKLSRSIQLFTGYLLLKLNMENLIKNKDLLRIINYYEKADLILYVGGGSLRTVKGIRNSYVFFTILMIFLYANHYKVKKILSPISFGPFAYNWQYRITAKIIEKSDVISFREKYSQLMFKKYSNNKSILSSDLALFLKKQVNKHENNSFTIGFTIRNWLNEKEQNYLEWAYADALYKFSKQINTIIQPIIQVTVPGLNQLGDLKATRNVIKYLSKYGITTKKEFIIRDLNSAINIYGQLNLLLGMRMHSNIIAGTQGTPFLAVSYEYKTDGIAHDLGVENFCIKAEDINDLNLFKLLMKTYNNRIKIKNTLEKSITNIKNKETQRWRNIFTTNISTLQ